MHYFKRKTLFGVEFSDRSLSLSHLPWRAILQIDSLIIFFLHFSLPWSATLVCSFLSSITFLCPFSSFLFFVSPYCRYFSLCDLSFLSLSSLSFSLSFLFFDIFYYLSFPFLIYQLTFFPSIFFVPHFSSLSSIFSFFFSPRTFSPSALHLFLFPSVSSNKSHLEAIAVACRDQERVWDGVLF